MKELTKEDHDNIADIIWFLRGWKHGEGSPFCEDHEESLEKVMRNMKKEFTSEEDDKAKILQEIIAIIKEDSETLDAVKLKSRVKDVFAKAAFKYKEYTLF